MPRFLKMRPKRAVLLNGRSRPLSSHSVGHIAYLMLSILLANPPPPPPPPLPRPNQKNTAQGLIILISYYSGTAVSYLVPEIHKIALIVFLC